MLPRLILSCAVLLQLGSLAYAADYPPYDMQKKLYADNDFRGKKAPELHVGTWLTGSAPDTQGKVVLYDFWATWCPPCKRLIPELNGFKSKFGNDLVVIGISDEPADTVRTFMQTHQMDYSVATDPSAKMKSAIRVAGIPHVMVVSPDGIVRWQGLPGAKQDPLTEAKLSQIIAASKAH